eukprot:589284_1
MNWIICILFLNRLVKMQYLQPLPSAPTIRKAQGTQMVWFDDKINTNVLTEEYNSVSYAVDFAGLKGYLGQKIAASKQRDESIEPLVETTNITKRGKRRRRRNRKKNRKLNRKTFKTLKKQFKMERIVLNNSNPDRVISNIRSSIQTTMDQK